MTLNNTGAYSVLFTVMLVNPTVRVLFQFYSILYITIQFVTYGTAPTLFSLYPQQCGQPFFKVADGRGLNLTYLKN